VADDRVVCLVFAKPPGEGASKTRLAPLLGAEGAAALARAFLRDTWTMACASPHLRPILATTDPAADHGLPPGSEVWDQGGGDLGERLERSMRAALASAPAALAIGADAPGMPAELLDAAAVAVREHSAVLGPTDDGGFWTLGLRECPVGLLAGLPWSSPRTAAATRERLRDRGLSVREIAPWWDVDTGSDLARWRREIPRERAPFTHAALDDLRWLAASGARG
jgi:rSAM/selenodomain-associated transferase 1